MTGKIARNKNRNRKRILTILNYFNTFNTFNSFTAVSINTKLIDTLVRLLLLVTGHNPRT